MKLRALLPSLALFLYGCAGAVAGGGGQAAGARNIPYPSLARRPIEKQDFDAPASAPVPAAPVADPALEAQVARLTDQLSKGASEFDGSYADARRSAQAAARSAVSSDPWIAAQVAISALESARNDCVSALAGLDTLYTDRVQAIAAGTAQGGDDRIAAARASALSIVDSQNDRLDALKALVPPA